MNIYKYYTLNINMEYYNQIYNKNSKEYKELRKLAILTNNEKNEHRNKLWNTASSWSKQKLSDVEKAYLYQSYKGFCSNVNCKKVLDEKTLTIEHIMPKSRHLEEMWQLDNFSILCGPCNSKKNNKHMDSIRYKPEQKKINMKFNSVVGDKAKLWYGGLRTPQL